MYSSNAASYRRLPVKSSMSVYDFDNQVFPAHINRNLTQLPDGPLTIVSPHNHEELEILCIRAGRAEAALNGQRTWLEAGDIMIDSPFCIHEVRIPKPDYFSNDYITVDLGYFKECCGRLAAAAFTDVLAGIRMFPAYIRRGTPGADALRAAVREVCKADFACRDAGSPEAADSMLAAKVYTLLGVLLAYFPPLSVAAGMQPDVEFIRTVWAYVDEHYQSELTTAKISADLGWSGSHFCRQFRKNFGMPFTAYLNRMRIQAAIRRYQTAPAPLSDIAAAAGFPDYCYFSRVFRKYKGVSPSKYFA